MPTFTYSAPTPFTQLQQTIFRRAVRKVWPDETVYLTKVPVESGADLAFGENMPANRLWSSTQNIERQLVKILRDRAGMPPEPRHTPLGLDNERVLYLDIETHDADLMWDMSPAEFFRLGQYAWGPNGKVILTTDLAEVIEQVEKADCIVAHNGHQFDFTAIYGKDSTRPLELGMDRKLFDTLVFANLAFPAPDKFVKRNGRDQWVRGPGEIMVWLGLDNLAYQLGIEGKIGDLKEMAKTYGGFGKIPVNDPEFLEYAKQDIVVLQEITHELIAIHEVSEYDWREQEFAAICAQNSRNGFRVDMERAQARADELAARKADLLKRLEEEFDFPTTGKSPWASKAGKEAIFRALEAHGITEETRPNWTRTATGNLSLGGEALIELTEGTEVEEFGRTLAELKGQRSLSQLAMESVHSDGKVHPSITSLQRSGRLSTTKPGLTVWSSQGAKAVEKSYFVPNADDEFLVELDYSNADQRVVAAYSGDEVYLERMEEGFDGHEMSGRFLFGDEVYDSQPKVYRQASKPAGHGWAYRASAKAVTRGIKVVPVTHTQAQGFIDAMNTRYAKVVQWQDECSAKGEIGYVVNDWGRKMPVSSGRSYTQSPALFGQSGTREIMVDALIRMARKDIRLITWLVAQVHDALVFSIPEKALDWAVPAVVGCMETTWQPKDGSGQPIHFPVSAGNPSKNWQEAGH